MSLLALEGEKMKIEHKHLKHNTWGTQVTVDERTYGLRGMKDAAGDLFCFRIYIPFGGNQYKDFVTEQQALDFCTSEGATCGGCNRKLSLLDRGINHE